MNQMRWFVFLVFIPMLFYPGAIADGYVLPEQNPTFLNAQRAYLHRLSRDAWVDSVMNTLTEDQKIGQLFMGMAYSNLGESHAFSVEKMIREQQLGGIIFMQGGPVRQAQLTNRFQQAAKVPLFIATDGEWGLAMRLDSTISFPRNMTLGALTDDRYVYSVASEIARQCTRIGVNINFAPVVDVNTNPANPVIGIRSFGENKVRVAQKASAFVKGLQHHGVMASAKHFPGHGDTQTDSHHTLPVVDHDQQRLQSIELYPFQQLFADTLGSVMVGHLFVPAFENTPNLASSLSPKIVTSLLKDSLGYQGLVFTDALNMKGVSGYHTPGQIVVQALAAGTDILLTPNDIPACITAIKAAIGQQLTWPMLDEKVRKILAWKYEVGLHEWKPVQIQGIMNDINNRQAVALKSMVYEQAVTVVKNPGNYLPFRAIDSLKIGSISIGAPKENPFQKQLGLYHSQIEQLNYPKRGVTREEMNVAFNKLKTKDVVIVGLHQLNHSKAQQFGLSSAAIELIARLEAANIKVVTVVFGNPYSLALLEKSSYLVCAYEDDPLMQGAVPQVLFGAVNNRAKLPVTASATLPEGTGIQILSLGRLGFGLPESVGMNTDILEEIDEIAKSAIREEATPGCQVLVAKNGRVIYHKAFGRLSYGKPDLVTEESLYDIASLTKVLATLQCIMWLDQQKKLDLNRRLVEYMPETAGTNKADMRIRDILMHQAGLQAFYPFWNKIMKNKAYDPAYLSTVKTEDYSMQLSPYLFGLNTLEDSVWKWTLETTLTKHDGYVYSDLGFVILKRLVEKITGQRLDAWMHERFYGPMGLTRLCYQPLARFPKENIAPTEMDIYQRKNLVHGFVHDPTAALQNGIGGNAGLFSNAFDVAAIMQMHLQEGFYGGAMMLEPETVQRYFSDGNNNRGLGWDKEYVSVRPYQSLKEVSYHSFGHTGFTGTCAWADPDNKLVYIFLSNRIHPFIGNQKLMRSRTRKAIHEVVYRALDQPSKLMILENVGQ